VQGTVTSARRAKATAKEIAEQTKPRFAQQGRIQ